MVHFWGQGVIIVPKGQLFLTECNDFGGKVGDDYCGQNTGGGNNDFVQFPYRLRRFMPQEKGEKDEKQDARFFAPIPKDEQAKRREKLLQGKFHFYIWAQCHGTMI